MIGQNQNGRILDERIQTELQMLDDVFHRMIIALERLEKFLEIERRGKDGVRLTNTGMCSSRDKHDDQKNPPTRESMLREVLLQCSSLFFQTEFDDKDLFTQTMKYFMKDLLEWYGGRGKEIPYDEVEMCVQPILVSLSRQIDSVADIMQVYDDYVAKLRHIEDFSDEEKEKAIENGFINWVKATHGVSEQLHKMAVSGKEVDFTVHRRGTTVEGYIRLMNAMLTLYPTNIPAKKVRATFTTYVDGLPEFTDERVENVPTSKIQNTESKEDQKKDSPNVAIVDESK